MTPEDASDRTVPRRHRRPAADRRSTRPRATAKRRRSGPSARRPRRPDVVARTPSSTRSTSAASPTATATAPATSPASAAGCPYLRDLGVDALWFTPWYLSPLADGGYDVADYRAIDPAFGTPRRGRGADRRGPRARASGRSSTSSPTTSPTGTPGSRRRSRPGPARRSASSSGSAPAAASDGELPPNDWPSEFGGSTWTRTTDPDGTPATGTCTCSPPSSPTSTGTTRTSAPSTRTSCASGSTAAPTASASTRRRCSPRTRRCPTSRPSRPRRAPLRTTATSSTTSTAPGARSPTPTPARGSSSARSGCRTPTGSPATCARTSCTPPSTSTSWPAPGTPRGCATSIDATLAAHAPVGAPPTWVLSNHDVTRPVTRYGREDTSFDFRRKRFGTPTDLELGRRRARAAALLTVALPGSLYVYQGEELGLDEVEVPLDEIQDPMHDRSGGTDPGRDGCRVPLPWSGDDAAVRLQPGRRDDPAVAAAARGLGRRSPSRPRPPTRTRCSTSYRAALRHPPRRGRPRRRPVRWLAAPPDVLAFARGTDFVSLTNLSGSALPLPPHREVLAGERRRSRTTSSRPTRRSGCARTPRSTDSAWRLPDDDQMRTAASSKRQIRDDIGGLATAPHRGERVERRHPMRTRTRRSPSVLAALAVITATIVAACGSSTTQHRAIRRRAVGRGSIGRRQRRRAECRGAGAGHDRGRRPPAGRDPGSGRRPVRTDQASSRPSTPGSRSSPRSTTGPRRRSRRRSRRARCRTCSRSRSPTARA